MVIEADLTNIKQILARMNNEDLAQRQRGLPKSERWRSIPPESGRFLFHSVLTQYAKVIVEIGMSHGYSTIWLALAAMLTGGKVSSYEVAEWRYNQAISNFEEAGVMEVINPILLEDNTLPIYPNTIDLAFIDAEKEDYINHFYNILPKLSDDGVIIADNILSHKDQPGIQEYVDIIHSRKDMVSTIIPVGKGLSYSQKIPQSTPRQIIKLFRDYEL